MDDVVKEIEVLFETQTVDEGYAERAVMSVVRHGMIPDGSVPSGWRFVSMSEPEKVGIPATIFEVAMAREIRKLHRAIEKLRKRLSEYERTLPAV